MYVALYNETTRAIEGVEEYQEHGDAVARHAHYEQEARARGDGWVAYIGEDPFAWPTEEELQAQAREARRIEILAELRALDARSIRAMRAKASGHGSPEDNQRLDDYEADAVALRAELAAL